jgi:beta-aspartyl-peptidase (threonine type)
MTTLPLLLALALAYQPADKPADAVRAVLSTQADMWNKGDLSGFMSTYWDSDELTFFSGGTVTKGRRAVTERYRKNYQSEGKEMGTLTFSELEVDLLGADSALARGRWKVTTAKGVAEGLFTLILKKVPDGWKIVHDHTSNVEPKKPQ